MTSYMATKQMSYKMYLTGRPTRGLPKLGHTVPIVVSNKRHFQGVKSKN